MPDTTQQRLDDVRSQAASGNECGMLERYCDVRRFTEVLAAPLSPEDCCVQSMPDASPTKWHLAHTTWFFETFLLEGRPGYVPFDPAFRVLFNSYYNDVGAQFPRPQRGVLSRPSLADVMYYRQYVDEVLLRRLEKDDVDARTRQVLEIGLHHEQQHQELLLTDIKHVLAQNPLMPVYRERDRTTERPDQFADNACGSTAAKAQTTLRHPPRSNTNWIMFDEGLYEIGRAGEGFAFDNEGPRHRTWLDRFDLATLPVTCGQWLDFMADGGYDDPRLWLSLGWSAAREQCWEAPLYWFRTDDRWQQFTLAGPQQIDPDDPVCHVSFFEADAFARWAGARLPNEAEWEVAAAGQPQCGCLVDTLLADHLPLHPSGSAFARTIRSPSRATSLFGNVWEWTASPYTPYPGYHPPDGALGEYNGKFMSQQYVLRGGSVATHSTHIRPTYRNFFPPEARWQFSGLRLAR